MNKCSSHQEKIRPFDLMFQDLKPYANDVGIKTATSTNKRHYRNQDDAGTTLNKNARSTHQDADESTLGLRG